MHAASSTQGWGELFLASSGATAALSGLIFVGLSVNINTVLTIDRRWLPAAFGLAIAVAAVNAWILLVGVLR
jgi:hypothetical protein